MDFCKDTCDDRAVPRPATGKTPLRNIRVADEVWLPALAKAVAEGTTVTEVVTDALRNYTRRPPGRFTFTQWPDANPWLEANYPGWRETAAALMDTTAGLIDEEYTGVAMWLAMTRHPSDRSQQQRVIAGLILGRADMVTKGGWRTRYTDSRALLRATSAVLAEHLPG